MTIKKVSQITKILDIINTLRRWSNWFCKIMLRNSGDSKEILKYVKPDTDVVAVDEVQFFDHDIVDVCEYLADRGLRVMVAGLDKDFRGEPFGVLPELLTRAEFVTKLTAVCAKCGAPATRTQRLVDGKPASFEDPIVLVGAVEHYEPRCRHCHEILNKPHKF